MTPDVERIWDEIAKTFTDEEVHADVVAARNLERLATGWRRTMEQWFVDRAEVRGIVDPDIGTLAARRGVDALTRTLERVSPSARRVRMMIMMIAQLCVDEGFRHWPDIGAIKREIDSILSLESRHPHDLHAGVPILREVSASKPQLEHKELPEGFDARDYQPSESWIVIPVDLLFAFANMPAELQPGLAKVDPALLDELVGSWAETRPGAKPAEGALRRSKYTVLERVLNVGWGDRTKPAQLKKEWMNRSNR